jgi:tetratricopeptide (TPR) repeat protein
MAPTASSYDLFLSYNSADHRIVEEVARKLADAGLKELFLDRWNLSFGTRWRPALEEALGSSKAMAIFVGPGEMGSWQQREVDIALDLQSKSANFPVIPVLLPGCEPPLGFLGQLTWVDLRTQALDVGIAILVKAARREKPGPDLQKDLDSVRASICPYRGLLYFREEDAPFFFGREVSIEKLMDEVQRQSLVAVVGASGSGKSSVVRAGLVPKLRKDRHTIWETMILVPTDQPLKAIAAAFLPLLEPSMSEVDRLAEASKLAEHLRSGTISLHDIVGRILQKQSGTDRVLIVVDQFEELYTLTSSDEAGRRFLDELLAITSGAGCKVKVVLTLRGDFVGKALGYRPLSDRLQGAQINLGPMTREELECAVRKPAEKIQLEFEAGLVRRILNDVGDEPGNLPLLEFVLKELWDKRHGRILLNETYDAIGGLQGAVATKADELFKGLSPAEQKILQRIFLRIVRPSAESGLDTRRRATFSELPPEGTELVFKLANERLLVTNKVTDKAGSGPEQTVEVAHEALISNWGTLRGWVNEDREFLLWRDRLGPLVAEWERAQESAETLLRGPLLIETQKWIDERSQDLSDQERKFISASRAEKERLAREEKERQQRELAEQAAAAKSLRRLAWVLAVVALAAVGGAIFGFLQKNEAEKRKQDAEVAKAKSNDARNQADGLINFMLYDLRDKLRPIGRLDVLEDVAKKAKEYLERLPKELESTSRQEQQGAMLSNLGDVLVAQGKLQEALDAYQRSLAIAKRLAEQDKSNSGWQRDLSVSYEKVGDVLVAQGKLQEALDAYQQSLKIRQILAEQDKSNSGWQRDLIVSLYKIGTTTAKMGAQDSLGQAQEFLRTALNLADKP